MGSPLGVLVKPTSSVCNLDCNYCFYLQKAEMYPWDTRPRMTPELFERFVDQYAELSNAGFSFAWQGGEPTLMGLGFYEKALDIEIRAARAHRTDGIWHITNSLQTNGTLLDDAWADFFRAYQFLVGISLDGPAEWHNTYRRDRAGHATHAKVLKGMEALALRGVEFNVLCAVQKSNVGHGRELLHYFADLGVTDVQFLPVAKSERLKGHLAGYSISPEEYGRFLEETFDEWMRIGHRRIRIRFFDNLIQLLLGLPSQMCIVAPTCGQYVVLEHNGDCYPCDFFVEREWYLGNIASTPLRTMVMSDAFRRFTLRKSVLHEDCRGCEWRPVCHGECPKYRMLTSPSAEGSLPYFCGSYKQFYGSSYDRVWRVAAAVGEEVSEQRRDVQTHALALGIASTDACPCGSGETLGSCCGGPDLKLVELKKVK